MKYTLAFTAVLLCTFTTALDTGGKILDVHASTPIEPEVSNSKTTGLSPHKPEIVHDIPAFTTTINTPDSKRTFLKQMFENSNPIEGQAASGPMLVVEIDDVSNDASLKLMHLPLLRNQNNKNEQRNKETTSSKPSVWSQQQYNNLDSNIVKSRKARDVDFKIYDRVIIQQLIDTLKMNDPQRAAMLQSRINRVVIKVEVDDDDEKDYLEDARFLQFARYLGLPFSRRRRSVNQEVNSQDEKQQTEEAQRKEEKASAKREGNREEKNEKTAALVKNENVKTKKGSAAAEQEAEEAEVQEIAEQEEQSQNEGAKGIPDVKVSTRSVKGEAQSEGIIEKEVEVEEPVAKDQKPNEQEAEKKGEKSNESRPKEQKATEQEEPIKREIKQTNKETNEQETSRKEPEQEQEATEKHKGKKASKRAIKEEANEQESRKTEAGKKKATKVNKSKGQEANEQEATEQEATEQEVNEQEATEQEEPIKREIKQTKEQKASRKEPEQEQEEAKEGKHKGKKGSKRSIKVDPAKGLEQKQGAKDAVEVNQTELKKNKLKAQEANQQEAAEEELKAKEASDKKKNASKKNKRQAKSENKDANEGENQSRKSKNRQTKNQANEEKEQNTDLNKEASTYYQETTLPETLYRPLHPKMVPAYGLKSEQDIKTLENCDLQCPKFDLNPVCASNGFCVREFPNQCIMDTFVCKNPHSGLHLTKMQKCAHKYLPRCTDHDLLAY